MADVPVRHDDLMVLLLCGTRYSLGCSSYAPSTVCDLLGRYGPRLTPGCLGVLAREIRNHGERGGLYGFADQQKLWMRTADELERLAEVKRQEAARG